MLRCYRAPGVEPKTGQKMTDWSRTCRLRSVSSSRHWLYAGLALATGYGVVRLLEGPQIEYGKSRILLVGDSLAVGLGPYLRELSGPRRVAFDSTAAVGTRIDQWSSNATLKAALAAFRPTLVLVSLGTNDAYMQGGVATAEQQRLRLRELLSLIKAHGADYVWIGPPALPAAKNPYVLAMLKDEIPLSHYYHSERLDLPRGPDGLHPTLKGYAGWAGLVWTHIGG